MINAKDLANQMVDALEVNSSFVKSFANGALELPVDLFYLGYSYLDTDSRWANSLDGERCIRLVKNGFANRKSLQKIANIIIDRYLDKIDVTKIRDAGLNSAGKLAGSMVANRIILGNIGSMFADRMIAKMLTGFTFSSLLSLGAIQARAIYTSRELSQRDPELYCYLKNLGNLDLLYFLLEKRMHPFETATLFWKNNRRMFDEVSRYFLQRVQP